MAFRSLASILSAARAAPAKHRATQTARIFFIAAVLLPNRATLGTVDERGSMRPGQLQRVRLLAGLDVLLELRPELTDGVLDRPAGAVGQAADRRPRHDADLVADLLQDLQVLRPALPAAHAIDDLEHPPRPLAARRTLAARLVREEAARVVQH